MSKYLEKTFYNPYNSANIVEITPEYLIDEKGEAFKIANGVIHFFKIEHAEKITVNEYEYSVNLDFAENLEKELHKHTWSEYYNFYQRKKFKELKNLLDKGYKEVCFLGCGSGYDIAELIRLGFSPDIILASDLSEWSARIIAEQLKNCGYSNELVVFTSDFDHCPVKRKDIPIVIFEALHHAPDMHTSIECLLKYGYSKIIFVDPTTNFLMKLLSRFGVSRRVEYSGLYPDRLDLKRLNKLSKLYNYNTKIMTMWEFPEDYFQRTIFSNNKLLMFIFINTISILSWLTNLFKFGNMSLVKMEKNEKI